MITLLDGPMGSELAARGVYLGDGPWSANAVTDSPEIVSAIHADYVQAGAMIHTANTFRTQPLWFETQWRELTDRAVNLAREQINRRSESTQGQHHQTMRVAGSLGPIADCYRPDLSPEMNSLKPHHQMASQLVQSGCDLILCETFANPIESIIAIQQSVKTGCEAWIGLTAGPNANLMTPDSMAETAARCVESGSSAVIVCCTEANASLAYLQALEKRNLGVPLGVSANAGPMEGDLGWHDSDDQLQRNHAAMQYAKLAMQWIDHGATIIGACCGCSPLHLEAINERLRKRDDQGGRR